MIGVWSVNTAEGIQQSDKPAVVGQQPHPPVTIASIEDEIANGVTHGIGLLLAIGGLFSLCVLTAYRGNVWHIVGCTIYGLSLVILYMASTLYHSVQKPAAKAVLRTVDHAAIFLLIAGTYTPFTLVNLRGPLGWGLFAAVWTLAVIGIVMKIVWGHRWQWFSLAMYIGMGWICLFAARPLMASLPSGALWLLLAGGLSYTIGTIFYALDDIRFFHAVWHVFVMAGSIFHFFAVAFYVVPWAR